MKIWCVEHDRAPVLGGAAVGGVCSRHQVWVSLHLIILEYQTHVSDAVQAQLSQAISQALSQVSIPSQA
ncbi:hypothetical protein Taro_038395, partial [Colocasia esculenta]|nr:hypothetical protein [Colocasia esculenta]